MNIVLASNSPRRKLLLDRIKHTYIIIPPNIDESSLSTSIKPKKYCIKLAMLKGLSIARYNPSSLVIGADTIVEIDKNILNKPKNNIEAKKMLLKLSNKTHLVHTGVSIIQKEKNIQHNFVDTTHVTFYSLNNNEINYYINNYNVLDKAGSYGIQDFSSIFVKNILGCYDNVMGFPLAKFHQELKKIGINLLDTIS